MRKENIEIEYPDGIIEYESSLYSDGSYIINFYKHEKPINTDFVLSAVYYSNNKHLVISDIHNKDDYINYLNSVGIKPNIIS